MIIDIINNIIIIKKGFLILILGYSIIIIMNLPLLALFKWLKWKCTSKKICLVLYIGVAKYL